jgi:hypothetical protein
MGAVGFLAITVAMTGCTAADVGEETGDAESNPGSSEAVDSTSEALLSSTVSATWWEDSVIEGSPVHRQGTNTLDQLLIHASGGPGRWHRNSSGAWAFEPITGAPAGVTARAIAGTYSGGGGFMDVFIVGSDNKIWWTFKDTGNPSAAWGAWGLVSTITTPQGATQSATVGSGTTIAVTNRGEGVMDVFWVTASNTIAHLAIANWFTPQSLLAGASSRPWFQSANGGQLKEVRAVSWDANRTDVFAMSGSQIQHSWLSNGSWGTQASPNREVITSAFTTTATQWSGPLTLAVSSPRAGQIDLIATAQERNAVPSQIKTGTTTYNGSWTKQNGWVNWNVLSTSPSSALFPARFFGATHFNDNGIGKVNLIGGGGANLDLFDGYVVD